MFPPRQPRPDQRRSFNQGHVQGRAHYVEITPLRGYSSEETAELVDLSLDSGHSLATARAHAKRRREKPPRR